MHVFASNCYAYVKNAKKLEVRSKQGIFVGYDRESPTYLIYFPESNKIEQVRCVKFFPTVNTPKFEEDETFLPIPLPTVDLTEQREGANDDVTSDSTERVETSDDSFSFSLFILPFDTYTYTHNFLNILVKNKQGSPQRNQEAYK